MAGGEAEVERRRPRRRVGFAAELRWTFAHRRGWLFGFAVNIVSSAVFLGYERYDERSGTLRLAGVAAELAAWVIAGTLVTNQLGDDADHVLDRLQSQYGVIRLLVLKSLVLGTLLLPITVAVSVVTQLDMTRLDELFSSVAEDLLDLFVVLLWLGVGSVTSVLLPYRSMPLRERWHRRSTWPRWATCQVIPYLIFFAVMPGLVWPAKDVAGHLFGRRHTNLVEYTSTFVLWGLFVWVVGLGLSALYVHRAPDRLRAQLRAS